MKNAAARNNVYIGLALLFAVALVLRLWGIWFGLPFSFKADEYHEVFRALELGSGSFNFERTGKGGYFYILFVEYGVVFVALKLAGIVDSAQDFARYFARDPSVFYLVGRATTAVVGTLNVFLAYRLGVRGYGIGAGVLAAVFLTIDFLNTEHSHFITVDVPMTCLATAALLFAVRMVTDGKASDYKWAALFAALATTTKLPAILLLVPLLVAHHYVVRRQDGGARRLFLARDLWWAAGIFVVVLAVTNPGLIVNPPWEAISVGADPEVIEENDAEVLPAVAPNLFVYYLSIIAESMGWPLLVVSLAGALYALWKRTPTDVILISFAAIYYLVFSSTGSNLFFPRYILPLIIVLALLAGRVLDVVWPRSGSLRQAAAVVFVVILAGFPAYRTVANNYLLTQTDTRTLARNWFDENIPQGSRVMIEGLKIEPTKLTVPLQDTPENMRANIEYYKSREPGKAKYLGFVLQVDIGNTYDLELVKPTELQSLEFYKNKGVEYLVIRPEAFASSRSMGQAGRDFLEDLQNDRDVSLLKSFRSDPRSRPGPDIDIYEVARMQRVPPSR
ncbi:MAG: glycosyltransferase family 39 protein [Woeseia sp.]